MKFFAIVGLGPNDVEITALIFSTKEKAEEFLNSKPDLVRHGDVWRDDEEVMDRYDENDPTYERDYAKQFYTGYYSGCGSCWGFEIREVEEGKPFVRFDLD